MKERSDFSEFFILEIFFEILVLMSNESFFRKRRGQMFQEKKLKNIFSTFKKYQSTGTLRGRKSLLKKRILWHPLGRGHIRALGRLTSIWAMNYLL